jgi:large subunit ribosomal protein L30
MKIFAVIRMRGTVKARKEAVATLKMLRLSRKMHCVVIPDTPSYAGMIHAAKDYITWGEISTEMLHKLIEKRGRKLGNKRLGTEGEVKAAAKLLTEGKNLKGTEIKPVFRLTPAKGGFKYSIKYNYPKGEIGYRGEKINELLEKMI